MCARAWIERNCPTQQEEVIWEERNIRIQQVGIRLAGVCDRTSRCDLLGLGEREEVLSSVVLPNSVLIFEKKRVGLCGFLIYPTLPRLPPLLVGSK